MKQISEKLNQIIEEYSAKIKFQDQPDWSYRPNPEKWSKKEILGHLIDSAANNHQRFVRVQFEDTPTIIYYPDNWCYTQRWNDAQLDSLINLWKSYNIHLAYIISIFPTEKLNNPCDIGHKETVTIEWVMKDYIRHLIHHLNQIV